MANTNNCEQQLNYSRADFKSKQDVRWCPGCGDYAILAALEKTLPSLGIKKENMVFVSGIGCAGRLPYYLNCYGFHTIHGRAPAVATGLKLTRPDLSVWVITGDGDGLSIGAHHLLHCIRRGIDLNIILFNNQIYGLTKGQYSPTSPKGQVTKTSPQGTVENPLCPSQFAINAGASFVGRGIDVDAKGLSHLFTAAAEHRGTSFIEIYQNCNVFNDGAFAHFAERDVRAERTIWLKHGEKMLFGKEQQQGIVLDDAGFGFKVEDIGSAYESVFDKVVSHDASSKSQAYYSALAAMHYPEMPVALGVLRQRKSS